MNWLRIIFSAAIIVIVVPALATSGYAEAGSKPPQMQAPAVIAVDPDYLIGKDDILNVQVWKEPELTRLVAVRSDGKISLPLVGDIQAAGLTTTQLNTELTKSLNNYMISAVVFVAVQDARSQRFTILGEVARPGNYPLIKPMTVLDALAVAGGFRDFAKTSAMVILRTASDGSHTRIPLRYKRMVSGDKQSNDNIELQARDTIIVP